MNQTQKMQADVVVVGTGPGGATVARDLTLQGKNVIMLERGADNKPTGKPMAAAKFTGGPGKGMMRSQPEGLMMVRCLTVGGTTNMYTGTAFDPDVEKFKKYNVDLAPELIDEVKKELKVAPLDDQNIGSAATMIMRSALELGFDWHKLNKFVDPSKGKPVNKKFFFGCETGGPRWQARDWVLDAQKRGAVLVTNAYVEEVIVENKTAVGVLAKKASGESLQVNAKVVVIAAGGVGSPVILQKSGIYEAGQRFFFDPFCMTFGYMDQPTDFSWEPPMVTGLHTDDGVMVTDMSLPFVMHANYATQAKKYMTVFKTKRALGLMTKISDDLEGSIGINEQITKRLTSDDHYKIEKGRAISRKILRHLGAKDIWFAGYGAAHPGGTCRIGAIVDSNLEAEYKNLFVSDASVIPEQWGLPPVLSVVCLARRLSKHIAPKL
jgi:choline dehydrogenase-like flavoprotein